MIALAFLLFVAIVVLLFVLYARNAFVCSAQFCTLAAPYRQHYVTFGVLTAGIAIAIFFAGYVQRFFLAPKPVRRAIPTRTTYAESEAPARGESPPRRIVVPEFKGTDTESKETPKKETPPTPTPSEPAPEKRTEPAAKPAPPKPKKDVPVRAQEGLDAESTRKRRTQAHTKEDIARIVATRTGLSPEVSRAFIDDTFAVISEALANHEKVAIHQFGTFYTNELKARTINVPSKPEESTTIPAHHVVRFKHSPAFETYLNDKGATAPPITPDERKVLHGEPRHTVDAKPIEREPLTKRELIMRVSAQTGLEKPSLEAFYEAFSTAFKDALKNDEPVRLYGFGTFETVTHKARVVEEPKSGEAKEIPAKRDVRFRPGNALIEQLSENPRES